MNTYYKIACLVLCSISLNSLYSNEPTQPNGPPHDTRLLQHLLEMDNDELANLRATVERIEKMPKEERDLLKSRIGKLKQMTPERIEAMHEKYRAIPEETREAMRSRWMKMSTEERSEWRQKLRSMSPVDRSAVFEKEGFLPARNRGTGKSGQPNGENGLPRPDGRGPPASTPSTSD
jgi:hypothetical protein